MRQKSGDLDTFVEEQQRSLNGEDYYKTEFEKIIHQSSPIPHFIRSLGDISAKNSVALDMLDIKTMLLKIKKLLEQV